VSKKAIYTGDVLGKVAHGHGTKRFFLGTTYVGSFCLGQYHDAGKLVVSPKEYMGGMFVHGKLNGDGYIFQNGVLYMGNIYDDIPNGYVTFYYPNETSWSGVVNNGFPIIAEKSRKAS
jgi:hypothetical protein